MAATSRIWGVRIVVGYTIGSFETKGTNYVHTKSEELHKEKKKDMGRSGEMKRNTWQSILKQRKKGRKNMK